MNKFEYAKFRVESNVNYLIFWATIFLTSIIGIIELLPSLTKLDIKLDLFFIGISILYGFLVIGIWLSMSRCINIYEENVYFWREGYFGDWYLKIPVIKHTTLDNIFLNKNNYIRERMHILPIVIAILFIALYFAILYHNKLL